MNRIEFINNNFCLKMITALHKDYASHIQEQKNKIMFLLLSFSIFLKKNKRKLRQAVGNLAWKWFNCSEM